MVYLYSFRRVGETSHIRMRGQCTIPAAHTQKPIPYKYVVVSRHEKKKQISVKTDYEFVAYAQRGGNVNRILIIPEALKGQTSGLVDYNTVQLALCLYKVLTSIATVR